MCKIKIDSVLYTCFSTLIVIFLSVFIVFCMHFVSRVNKQDQKELKTFKKGEKTMVKENMDKNVTWENALCQNGDPIYGIPVLKCHSKKRNSTKIIYPALVSEKSRPKRAK